MLKKISYVLLIISALSVFGLSAMGQTIGEATVAVKNAKLSAIDLPTGALRIRDESVPAEIKTILSKIIGEGGGRIKQGDLEVVVWGGNYDKANGTKMIDQLAKTLQDSGWTYETAEKADDVVFFTLIRETPNRQALVGFFAPSDEAFIFATTEMLRADGAESESQNSVSSDKTESDFQNLIGTDINQYKLKF